MTLLVRPLAALGLPLALAGALWLWWAGGLGPGTAREPVRLARGALAGPALLAPARSLPAQPPARQVAGAPAQTQAALPAPSHESARDLYALFEQSRSSADRHALEEARLALALCTGHARHADALKIAFSGGAPGMLRGEPSPARQQASAEMDGRCQGFGRVAHDTLEAMQAQLQERLQALGSHLADGPRQESASLAPALAMELLAAGEAASFERARPALVAALVRDAHSAEDTDEWQDIQTAVLLASCESGRDCSASAFESLRRCTWQGRCGQGLFEHWQEGLAASRVDVVEQLRARIVRAIRSGDATSLGLQ